MTVHRTPPQTVTVLLPTWPGAGELDDLPAGTTVVFPGDDAALAQVEFAAVAWTQPAELSALLQRLPAVRVLQSMSAGVDWLLPHVPPDVVVCDAAGVSSGAVAEWAMAVILSVYKHLPELGCLQRVHRWHMMREVSDLAGAHVLIVGHGSIGRELEARLRPFGVTVTGVARRARDGVHAIDDLPGLLPSADVVVLLVPSTAETVGLVDAAFLARLRDGALLVNGARAEIVGTDALLAELHRGRIRAALDVASPEPLPPEHPLWNAPGLLLTPHIAGLTPSYWPRSLAFVRAQLQRYVDRIPLRNIVTDGY